MNGFEHFKKMKKKLRVRMWAIDFGKESFLPCSPFYAFLL